MPAMFRLFSAGLLVLALGLPAAAQPTSRIGPLYEALGLPSLLEIMREEGIGYGRELERDLFPGRGRSAWEATVGEIYALKRMEAEVAGGLDARLTDAEIAVIRAFFDTEAGARIVALETAARRAMLDEDVEVAAHDGWLAIEAEDGPRWALLSEFAEVNDLVESNVAGAMTSNYEFYMGLVDGKAFDFQMTEGEVLADVWSQEQSIREETVDWVFSFTSLAYQPLSDAEFRDYVSFTATPAGQALNAALFTAFNDMFAGISRDLGLGAAHYLAGQDI
jgi:hypothetical protein